MIITDKAQIKIAELIESDLKLPADATFTRSSVAYLSDGTQVDVNTPRFEAGKFGKAIMVEEGTENLVPSLVDFTLRDYESRSLTVIEDNMIISTCIKEGDTAFAAKSPKVNVTEGEIYTFSFYAKANGLDRLDGSPSASDFRTKINWYDGNNTLIAWDMLTDTTLYEDWKRYIITAQAPTGAVKAEVIIGVDVPNFSYVGAKAYFKNIQLEQKPYATSYIDGTRAAELLKLFDDAQTKQYFPTASSWSIELWAKLNNATAATRNRQIFSCTEDGGFKLGVETGWGRYRAYLNDNGTYKPIDFLTAFPFDDLQWHYVVLVYDYQNHKAKLFLDGVKQNEISITQLYYGTANYAFFLGTENNNGIGLTTEILNGLVDDLRISSIARNDEEILQSYLSNKLLSIDEHTTYKLDFDSKVTLEESGELLCDEIIEADLSLEGATFARNSVAYKSDGTLVQVNEPRLEPGKFGKAIMVEEGTTNIGSPASLFDSSWTLANGTSTVIDAYTRKYTFTSTPFGAFAYKTFTLTTGVTYTWSAEIKGEGSTVGKQVRLQSAAESAYGTPVTLTTEWQRVTLTFTATDTSRAVGFIGIPVDAFAAGNVVYVRNFQLEQKPYVTSFIDGTRAAEILKLFDDFGTKQYFPSEADWTLELYVKKFRADASTRSYRVFSCTESGGFSIESINSALRFVFNDNGTYKNIYFQQSYPLDDLNWHYIAVVYDYTNHKVKLFLDDVKQAEFSITKLYYGTFNCSFFLGTENNNGSGTNTDLLNGLIDDIRISNRARTDEEILAAYQSGKPLLADEWTTYKLDFDDKVRITAQGQIICNEFIEI